MPLRSPTDGPPRVVLGRGGACEETCVHTIDCTKVSFSLHGVGYPSTGIRRESSVLLVGIRRPCLDTPGASRRLTHALRPESGSVDLFEPGPGLPLPFWVIPTPGSTGGLRVPDRGSLGRSQSECRPPSCRRAPLCRFGVVGVDPVVPVAPVLRTRTSGAALYSRRAAETPGGGSLSTTSSPCRSAPRTVRCGPGGRRSGTSSGLRSSPIQVSSGPCSPSYSAPWAPVFFL